MTIELYSYGTSNGCKASVMLGETSLPDAVRVVDTERGEQRQRSFLALNPTKVQS